MDAPLKFVADEGFDKAIVLALRAAYDVSYVIEFMAGADDEEILEKARAEKRIVLTLDKDFGELVFRQHKSHVGVILCRLEGLTEEQKCNLVVPAVDKYGHDLLNSFTVIQHKNIRIRKM